MAIDREKKQINYLLDKNATIGTDGTRTHGPDSVISMLHATLLQDGRSLQRLHADNCSGGWLSFDVKFSLLCYAAQIKNAIFLL